jgi:glucokinase
MYIGIDIGGTHIRIGQGSRGKAQKITDIPTRTFAENKHDIKNAISKLGDQNFEGVGVGSPGPLGFKESKILEPNKFKGWTNKDIAKELEESLNLPTYVVHDASALALAEYTYGSQKGKDPFLYITVSTGIGTGIVNDGKLLHGSYYPHAGHQFVGEGGIKCWCGQDSDLESTVSGWALKERTGKHPKEVEGSDLWYESMEILSKGVSNLIMSYSPQVVVIGGGMTKNREVFFPPVINGVKKYLKIFPVPSIHPTSLNEPGIVGAITFAEQSTSRRKTDQ